MFVLKIKNNKIVSFFDIKKSRFVMYSRAGAILVFGAFNGK